MVTLPEAAPTPAQAPKSLATFQASAVRSPRTHRPRRCRRGLPRHPPHRQSCSRRVRGHCRRRNAHRSGLDLRGRRPPRTEIRHDAAIRRRPPLLAPPRVPPRLRRKSARRVTTTSPTPAAWCSTLPVPSPHPGVIAQTVAPRHPRRTSQGRGGLPRPLRHLPLRSHKRLTPRPSSRQSRSMSLPQSPFCRLHRSRRSQTQGQ